MLEKLKSTAGETLMETLIALAVVLMALTMLAAGILSAARVNQENDALSTGLRYVNGAAVSGVTVTISHGQAGVESNQVAVDGYVTDDDNSYFYYEVKTD